MTDIASIPLADTSDMVGVHRVFRQALDAAPALIRSADGDTARADVVATYLDHVLRLLSAHHEGEDELMTPRLVERCTADEARVVQQVAHQHEAVLGGIADSQRGLASWRGSADAESAAVLVAAVEGLRDALVTHLDDEERLVLPIAGRHLNAAEWGELPGHAMRSFSGEHLWLVLGLVREQMSPEQIAHAEAHMPPPVLGMWREVGQDRFAEFVGALRR